MTTIRRYFAGNVPRTVLGKASTFASTNSRTLDPLPHLHESLRSHRATMAHHHRSRHRLQLHHRISPVALGADCRENIGHALGG